MVYTYTSRGQKVRTNSIAIGHEGVGLEKNEPSPYRFPLVGRRVVTLDSVDVPYSIAATDDVQTVA
jgi:hypothetical protein